MAISISKRKSKAHQKKLVEPKKECCSSLTTLVRFLYRVPIAISLLLLIYLWSSSTTIISGKIVHVCVSARKLNSLYCLSAGAQPNLEVPVPPLEKGANNVGYSSNSSSPIVTLELEKEIIQSQQIVDNSTIIGSPIVTYLEYEKEIQTPNIDDKSTIISPIITDLELEKEIQSPFVDNSANSSPTITQELEKEIQTPSNDNGTIVSPIITNLELDKEIQSPFVDNNSTDSSPTITQELEKELPSPIVGDSATIEKIQYEEISNPIGDNSTIISPNIIVNEAKYEKISVPSVDNSANTGVLELSMPMKAVEDIMKDLRSWTANKTGQRSCEGRGIYVYDLPPKFNADLVGRCGDMLQWIDFCKHFSNGGLGEPIPSLGPAWHRTHMYALEQIFHSRALNHPCRVHDESEARLFYVPYYGGLDVLRWHFKNVSEGVKDALGLDLIAWLDSRPSWRRFSGRDHVFVLGKISWDFRRTPNHVKSWGTSFLEHAAMQGPTKVTIERQPWHPNDVGAPHPTYFHPRSDAELAAWQTRVIGSPRPHLASFAGAARPGNPKNIRSALIRQCAEAGGETCRVLGCTAKEGCGGEAEDLVGLFEGSEFCFQPPGDSATRRSVFDSLVSGCIPVLFDPMTAYYQYPWHLPEDHRKYSVFVDQRDVRDKEVNVIEILMQISRKERDDMRRFIVYDLLPGLVYAHPESKLDHFRDAFSITIDSLVERVNGLSLNVN